MASVKTPARVAVLVVISGPLLVGLYLTGLYRLVLSFGPLLAIFAVLVLCTRHYPKLAFTLALALPILARILPSVLPSPLLLMYVSGGVMAILYLRGLHLRGAAATRTGHAALLAFLFLSIFVGVLGHGRVVDAKPLITAVITTGLVGLSVMHLDFSSRELTRCLAAVGALISWAGAGAEALATSRGSAVLGLNANGIGLIAAFGLTAALTNVLRDDRRWLFLYVPCALACTYGLLAARSRGSWLLVGIALVAFFLYRYISKGGIAGLAGLLVFGGIVAYAAPKIFDYLSVATGRFQAGADQNIGVRQDALLFSLQEGWRHPFAGVGLNAMDIVAIDAGTEFGGLRAHNLYAGVFGETGLFTLLALLILCLEAVRRSRVHDRASFALVCLALASGVTVLWWPSTLMASIELLVLGWASSLPRTAPKVIPKAHHARRMREGVAS